MLAPADWRDRVQAAFPQPWDPMQCCLVAASMGSISHGTYVASTDPAHLDDVDIMMIEAPPPASVLGLKEFEHWVWLKEELDVVCYSVKKFAKLALRGNPNVLGMLWLPERCVLYAHPAWSDWVGHRSAFLSWAIHKSFAGYARSQLHRLGAPNTRGYMGSKRKELFGKHGYDVKNASHCIRLLRMGIELMETGALRVDRTGIDAEELKAIKAGKWSLGKVEREAEQAFKRMEAAEKRSVLPGKPDLDLVEDLVIRTHMRFWDWGQAPGEGGSGGAG